MHARFVFFDLGNVLVNFDHQLGIDSLAQLTGCPTSLVRQVIFDSDLQSRYESGLVTGEAFAAEVNAGLASRLEVEHIHEAVSAIFEPNHSILAALELVRRAGVRMGVLSNTCEAHWQWIIRQRWPMLADWFDIHVLSYEVGGMKPQDRIYLASEELAGCTGRQIFFTDDRSENVAAAAARGWSTYHYRSTDELIACLNEWLIQNYEC